MEDLRIKLPFTLVCSGPSSCGKSFLLKNLISNSECFTEPIVEIVWIYAKHTFDQDFFDSLKHLPIQFIEGYPEEQIVSNTLFKSKTHKLLIIDDIFTVLKPNQSLFDLFNILSHHQHISVIVTVQNLHGATPSQRSCLNTILRSATHLVLFVNRRMTPVFRQIAASYFPGQTHRVLCPFNQILAEGQPHTYMVFDFVTNDDRLQIRQQGLLPGEKCYIFEENEENRTQKSQQTSRT